MTGGSSPLRQPRRAEATNKDRAPKRRRSVTRIALVLLATAAAVNLLFGLYGFYERVTHPLMYESYILQYAEQYGVPPQIVCAVINSESSFDAQAVSSAGAMGLMQITGATFDWLLSKTGESRETEALFEAETNIRYGTYFLSVLYNEFGSWETAFAAYNAGRNRVMEWLKDDSVSEGGRLVAIPYPETAHYVVRVSKDAEIYKKLYGDILFP